MPIISAPSNFGAAFALSISIALLLVVPGLFWNAVAGPARRLPSGYIPVPGLLFLSAAGAVLWLLEPGRSIIPGILVALPEGMMAAGLLWRCRSRAAVAGLFGEQGPTIFLLWGAVTVAAMASGLNRLPVALEFFPGSTVPGRMVASPPDHVIPYETAAYFYHGFDGRERSADYFGTQWSAASRGPLVPFAVVALFHSFQATPSDPPNTTPDSWPVTSEGAYLARMLGWLTNGLVILGVGHLLTVLRVPSTAYRIGMAWACLAPAILINTVFLWPKLLAGFFALLATACVIEMSWALAGFWIALAWLSHPVGILFLPGLGMLLLWRAQKEQPTKNAKIAGAARASARLVLMLALTAAPWVLYKIWLGKPDMFFDYLLADGYAEGGAVPHRATSLASWLMLRWNNIWFTLVPGAFFFSDLMSAWGTGLLSDPLRWTVQYAKTLPAELGFSLFGAAYLAFVRPGREPFPRLLLWCTVFLTFAIMLIVWGYSGDGLGRNSLEPLVPAVIVATVAILRPTHPVWAIGLTGLWLEDRWIDLSGAIGADGFQWSTVPMTSWIAWASAAGIGLSVVVWAWRGLRERAS